jgi:hypothetical protein
VQPILPPTEVRQPLTLPAFAAGPNEEARFKHFMADVLRFLCLQGADRSMH